MVKNNYQSLKVLLEQRVERVMQQKWIAKLMGYDFLMEYKKENENTKADPMSR